MNRNTKKVLVTGASGYIGGQICITLKEKGYKVLGVDLRPAGHIMPYLDEFVDNDFASDFSYRLLYRDGGPDAIIHCAGTSLVGPSLANPAEYFRNNVEKTHQYLGVMRNSRSEAKFIFSSSAAVYGMPIGTLDESHRTHPISPYGLSKLMIEQILEWYSISYGLDYVAFRYFNACGADEQARHGQKPDATHILARLFETAKEDQIFMMNGVDYDTPDGTCIRDYIHVQDVADAHVQAIETPISGPYNIGSGRGYSNLELKYLVESFLNKEVPSMMGPRRVGDPDRLVADNTKLFNENSFLPRRDINDIIKTLSAWYSSEIYNRQRTSDAHPS